MSIIEQATKRLEALNRAGVSVPWAAAGLAESEVQARVESRQRDAGAVSGPAEVPSASALRRHELTLLAPVGARAAAESTDLHVDAPMVVLDLEQLERSGHLVPTQTRSALAEEFRQIKRPLLKNARSKDPIGSRCSLIMVTSALPGDGKTFCAINLAMSMAVEIDTSILLVDADVVRPNVLQRLGVPPAKGLLDLLTDGQLSLGDLILKTNVPKLSILPAGTRTHASTELLASDAMEALLGSLTETHPDRVVIFDAPPLLVTTEARVLASRLGQVVMVVAASSTPRSVVAQAFSAVEQCPIVMSILNKAHAPEGPLGYGYYYG